MIRQLDCSEDNPELFEASMTREGSMTGEIYIIIGVTCIFAAIVLLLLSVTWIRTRKRELRKQWKI